MIFPTRSWTVWSVAAAIAAALACPAHAQERDRAKTPDRYKWNLSDLYASDAAWRSAKEALAADLPRLREYQGRLTSSAVTLADALDRQFAFDKELSRLFIYAGLFADQDTRDSTHQGMR
jgi:oligoendopeptidase F